MIGGCTFKIHLQETMIELLLLGVKSGLKKRGLGSAAIDFLKSWGKENNFTKILTYADLRAIGFFHKQGFNQFKSCDEDYKKLKKLIARCD